MAGKEDISSKYNPENVIKTLMVTARNLNVYGEQIYIRAERIIVSCHDQGTIREKHILLMLTSADNMKQLAGLFLAASRRYKIAASDLTGGATYNDVLPELNLYNIFINDQLKSETDGFKQILSTIRD